MRTGSGTDTIQLLPPHKPAMQHVNLLLLPLRPLFVLLVRGHIIPPSDPLLSAADFFIIAPVGVEEGFANEPSSHSRSRIYIKAALGPRC